MPSEKGKLPSPFGAIARALLQAAFCMGLYMNLVPHFPLSRFTDPVYQEWGFWKRLGYQYMIGFTARWKYYFIWSISEASLIVSGLGFTGWTDSSPPKPRWDRAKNVDILGVELAKSSVEIPLKWNIQVSTWLRHCEFSLLLIVACTKSRNMYTKFDLVKRWYFLYVPSPFFIFAKLSFKYL